MVVIVNEYLMSASHELSQYLAELPGYNYLNGPVRIDHVQGTLYRASQHDGNDRVDIGHGTIEHPHISQMASRFQVIGS